MTRFFRSVGTRLSLALFLVVAVALGIVYIGVIPSLQSRLVHTRLAQLESAALQLRQRAANDTPAYLDDLVSASRDIGARVVVFQANPIPGGEAVGGGIADSSSNGADITNDPVAIRALSTDRLQTGTVVRGGESYAEAAVPYSNGGYVLLLSNSLESQLGSVQLVKHRLLIAAGIALLIALLLGYGGARVFARRIRRLERAAERIAGGRFDQPFSDRGGDELGDLAAAFERMRVRLAQLDNARREFVANASHELRTPLFSLSGFLELMDDEELDESTRLEFLDSMREQVTRLTKLASDLLDLSRLDAGRLTVSRERVELAELGEDLLEEFGPSARAGGRVLTLDGSERVIASGDELRTLQIGRILVENALSHTPPGTEVRVRALTRGGRAVLEVEDEGGGIPREQQEQLFERFFRLDGTRASGSGLGLAIAKELAELMDGAVEVESRPGLTVFSLTLPLAQDEARPFSRQKPVGAGA
ncbi:MAG: HAMP domain-containing sensor histidine kinase [Gaiellaceae bacterium]